MKQLISIIGTRPQYIKLKPVYDYCEERALQHRVIDTGQHYDPKMSADIIEDLGLRIDSSAKQQHQNKLEWMASTILFLQKEMEQYSDPRVLLYGDTDSAFCAALVCTKMGIPFGHIEAGVRCGNRQVPEEVNRMYIDSVADINFCSAPENRDNLDNGILVGDLEYELLNKLNPLIVAGDYAVMTMHRKENMNGPRVRKVFEFIARLGLTVKLATHHSLTKKAWFKEIVVPDNLQIGDPLPYTHMVNLLAACKYILTDSGSIPKTAPFFGKRCLVLRNEIGWIETVDSGHSKTATLSFSGDSEWLQQPIGRQKDFYLDSVSPSRNIVDTILQELY